MPAVLIVVAILILLFNPELLPGIGAWLGGKSRKPWRQAKWVWSSFAGTEDEVVQAELEYGRECATAFAKHFSGKAARSDQELVKDIGARLARAVKDPRRQFEFAVLAAGQANAFALPGGFVFITDSLLDLCKRDCDEIAFFLGHEVGHIRQGHARDRMMADTLLSTVMARLPAAGQMLRQALSKGYSRVQELEADRDAVRLAKTAGFDPRASIPGLQRLAKVAPEPPLLGEYLSTHPSTSERIKELETLM
jgi:beta-barrel assembly-enhancing protease